MSELQRIVEDYLLAEGWTARPPIDPNAELRRIAYWRDPEHPTAAAVGLGWRTRSIGRLRRTRISRTSASLRELRLTWFAPPLLFPGRHRTMSERTR